MGNGSSNNDFQQQQLKKAKKKIYLPQFQFKLREIVNQYQAEEMKIKTSLEQHQKFKKNQTIIRPQANQNFTSINFTGPIITEEKTDPNIKFKRQVDEWKKNNNFKIIDNFSDIFQDFKLNQTKEETQNMNNN